jgi:outer membrane receptor protein involved in Fe transport
MKAGFQVQTSQANDGFGITGVNPANTNALLTTTGGENDTGWTEAVYVQDDYTITKALTLNAGVRFSAFQFSFGSGGASSSDDQVQPRIGLNFAASDTTKLHVFYGRLFMPAPLEDLREAFNTFSTSPVAFYDIKAEKDNYYETGIDQQIGSQQLATVNVYYKTATNMLDDTQLLNTSIASPYNYQNGYAYGIEYSLKGKINEDFSEYFNYSYEIAKGENISGGTFAINPSTIPANTYLFLDHVQEHTANTGLIFARDQYSVSAQGLFGSGLRTGPNNTNHLPSHFSFDLSAGYEFKGSEWYNNVKVSGDIFNIFNNTYPITIANGFNGSHYEAGREFFIRLTKQI